VLVSTGVDAEINPGRIRVLVERAVKSLSRIRNVVGLSSFHLNGGSLTFRRIYGGSLCGDEGLVGPSCTGLLLRDKTGILHERPAVSVPVLLLPASCDRVFEPTPVRRLKRLGDE